MATKTVAAPFTAQLLDIPEVGRPVYVIRNAEGGAVGITFSEAKAQRMLAFRIQQSLESAAAAG